MALILNIETSSPICSVCLAKDGLVIDYREDRTGNSHARILTVFIDELMQGNHLSYKDLDAIAVSAGPGSYTGLRIGTSTAKGLCYAASKPLIAVPTLLSLAIGIEQKSGATGYYLPVIDARRMDIYTALFNDGLNEVISTHFATLGKDFENTLSDYNQVYVGGSALAKSKDILSAANFHFVDGIECNSQLMAGVAEKKFTGGHFEDVAYFQPVYLREFGKL
ncbi:MAG: tsaB [Bacteroidota bacterium]|nr:tsaB [Bacteroidota bacterium]